MCLVKKVIIPLILFVIVFMSTYLILCYLPNLRIKLFAPPIEYFVESIKHMVLFKTVVSIAVGLLVVGVPCIIKKYKGQGMG